MSDVHKLRSEYKGEFLDVSNVDPSPFVQFKTWFETAVKEKVKEPNGMCLSTVSIDGMPSLRTVLLKTFDETGFVFYTNYNSRKALEIEHNPKVALIFPWYTLNRQVMIQGSASKISIAESLKYFLSRPLGSKISAWISDQSEVISSRGLLEKKWEEMKKKFHDGKVPLPDTWGGFRIQPETFEFWQGQDSRLHDRIYYSKDAHSNWEIERLAP